MQCEFLAVSLKHSTVSFLTGLPLHLVSLPYLLRALSHLEGPISWSEVEASTFTKLSAFMIIHTVFTTTISGGVLEELSSIIQNPLRTIDLLANSLPVQSTFFMQLVFADTFSFLFMELLRPVPILHSLLRYCVGPNLTEKERRRMSFFFRPLSEPYPSLRSYNMASISVLYFMILMVRAAKFCLLNWLKLSSHHFSTFCLTFRVPYRSTKRSLLSVPYS